MTDLARADRVVLVSREERGTFRDNAKADASCISKEHVGWYTDLIDKIMANQFISLTSINHCLQEARKNSTLSISDDMANRVRDILAERLIEAQSLRAGLSVGSS